MARAPRRTSSLSYRTCRQTWRSAFGCLCEGITGADGLQRYAYVARRLHQLRLKKKVVHKRKHVSHVVNTSDSDVPRAVALGNRAALQKFDQKKNGSGRSAPVALPAILSLIHI